MSVLDRLLHGPAVPDGMPEMFAGSVPPDEGDKQAAETFGAEAKKPKKKRHVIDRSPAHLKPKNRKIARRIAVHAMQVLLAHAAAVHYSQGPKRWNGIVEHLLASKGHHPDNTDCSGSTSWAEWNALAARFHKPDVVNGEHWKAGYTGTQAVHGLRIPMIPRLWLPADLILYGDPIEHVAMYVGYDRRYGHMVISQGSEAGPFYLRWDYRSDANRVKRYI